MTIYDQIGGRETVTVAVDQFDGRVLADDRLAAHFADIDPRRLKGHQRTLIGAALGGPAAYQGRRMAAAHEDLGITTAEFELVVHHLVDTLTELDVPAATIAEVEGRLTPLEHEIATA